MQSSILGMRQEYLAVTSLSRPYSTQDRGAPSDLGTMTAGKEHSDWKGSMTPNVVYSATCSAISCRLCTPFLCG